MVLDKDLILACSSFEEYFVRSQYHFWVVLPRLKFALHTWDHKMIFDKYLSLVHAKVEERNPNSRHHSGLAMLRSPTTKGKKSATNLTTNKVPSYLEDSHFASRYYSAAICGLSWSLCGLQENYTTMTSSGCVLEGVARRGVIYAPPEWRNHWTSHICQS